MSSSKASKLTHLGDLLALAKPHWKTLTIATFALVGGSAVNLVIPEIIRRLLNSKTANLLSERPLEVALILFGLFFAQGIFSYFRSLLFLIVGQRVVAKLRQDLYQSIIYKTIDFFDRSRTGDLVSRLNSDCLLIQDAVSIRISVIVRYALQVLVGVLLMTLISLRLYFGSSSLDPDTRIILPLSWAQTKNLF